MAATTEPTVSAQDVAASADATKKKTKKAFADNIKYAGIESVMPVKLKTSNAKGRFIAAAKDIPAGTIVSIEKASASVVRNQSFSNICHHCFKPAKLKQMTRPRVDAQGNQIPNQVEKFNVPTHSCAKCKMAAYCSEACQKEHAAEHDIQCPALAQVNSLATANKVMPENLRAVLALIGRRAAEKAANRDSAPDFASSISSVKPTPFGCVLDMNPNRHFTDREKLKDAENALKDLIALVPEHARVTLSEAVELYCIFYSNQHNISVNNQQVLALFPVTSLYFNHSCIPNCVYVGEVDGVICVRTMTDVPADTELTISYVEICQPREQRRRDLLLTRHFWCKCRRCSTLLSKSVDRFMDGIQCTECQNGVMIFEETKEVQDINELMTDVAALDQEIQGKFAQCESCPAQIEVTKLVDVLKAAITDYGAAHQTLQTGDFNRGRLMLEKFIKDYESTHILNPYNAYLVNTYTTLMNVCTQMQDLDRAIRYNSVVVQRMEGIEGAVPTNYPRLVEYHFTLGDMCLKQAKKKASNRTPLGRNTTRKYLSEAKSSLEKAYEGRKVVFGENSPSTQAAKRLFEESKREYNAYTKSLEKKKKKPAAPAPAAPAAQPTSPAAAAPAPAAAQSQEETSASA
ncbi:hypothetical protein LPJ53_005690 [Coemansia erecta]|uniref:SET domain-containing protein n=1 Tax=Coemansia erecta TaxID=147472 RepID=A0A9W7XW86_9FUNG|nr:hypothetical protein LPJ53_005690 [Coemansia erecta]